MKITVVLAKAGRKLSALQEHYQGFFKDKLNLHGVKKVSKMDTEKKSVFFDDIKKTWPKAKKELGK